jgi:hypothetical protein
MPAAGSEKSVAIVPAFIEQERRRWLAAATG